MFDAQFVLQLHEGVDQRNVFRVVVRTIRIHGHTGSRMKWLADTIDMVDFMVAVISIVIIIIIVLITKVDIVIMNTRTAAAATATGRCVRCGGSSDRTLTTSTRNSKAYHNVVNAVVKVCAGVVAVTISKFYRVNTPFTRERNYVFNLMIVCQKDYQYIGTLVWGKGDNRTHLLLYTWTTNLCGTIASFSLVT